MASGSGTLGSVACFFVDDGDYVVGVQVCDANTCDTNTGVATGIRNVEPTIVQIATDGPALQGQPLKDHRHPN